MKVKHCCQSCGGVMAVHDHGSYQEIKDCLTGMKALCPECASWSGDPAAAEADAGRRCTQMGTEICPQCENRGPHVAIMYGPNGCRETVRACDFCGGVRNQRPSPALQPPYDDPIKLPSSRSLEQLLPLGSQACARADILDF
jgi:hypothetical protein